MKTPILFLIFNRPDVTKQVFEVIRQVKPKKLFIAADGPRKNIIGESQLCSKTRDVVMNNIDWTCEVKTLFSDKNLGCKAAVSSAINWFFENVEEGIILEDDCLPHPDFSHSAPACWNITVTTKKSGKSTEPVGIKRYLKIILFYSLSIDMGLGPWKDRWQKYDYEMDALEDYIINNRINEISKSRSVQKNLILGFIGCKEKQINTWDSQWALTVFNRNGISISPDCNLISNIGHGPDASHTRNPNSYSSCWKLKENIKIKFRKKL